VTRRRVVVGLALGLCIAAAAIAWAQLWASVLAWDQLHPMQRCYAGCEAASRACVLSGKDPDQECDYYGQRCAEACEGLAEVALAEVGR
jgi:hypothetical protein